MASWSSHRRMLSICTMSKGKMTQKCFSTPETSLWDEPSVSGIPSLEGWGELQDGFNSGSEERESPTSNSLRLPLSKLLFTEPRPLSSSQLSIHTCQVQNTVDLEYKSKKGKKKKAPTLLRNEQIWKLHRVAFSPWPPQSRVSDMAQLQPPGSASLLTLLELIMLIP